MIALGGPKLKLSEHGLKHLCGMVSMIALGGPKLKLNGGDCPKTSIVSSF